MKNNIEDRIYSVLKSLRECEPEEVENILSESKKLYLQEYNGEKRARVLFAECLQTLQDRSVDPMIIEELSLQNTTPGQWLNKLITLSKHIPVPENHILFLPVIPVYFLGFFGLTNILKKTNGRIAYYGNHDLESYTSVVQVPKGPYYCWDVDFGLALPQSGAHAFNQIMEQERSPLTAEELIATILHAPSETIAQLKDPSLSILACGTNAWEDNLRVVELSWSSEKKAFYLGNHSKNQVLSNCFAPSTKRRISRYDQIDRTFANSLLPALQNTEKSLISAK